MSINFGTLQGLTIPEGVVTQIADASGRVLWMLSGSTVILEVEKITSDTYAGETTYTGEQFILLDIYPKTNGTVNVTYGGLTKTITDTSGAEEPNAQQVFFGTFNGVSDSMVTPTSGKLTIEGDCASFATGNYNKKSDDKVNVAVCYCLTNIVSLGEITKIYSLSTGGNTNLTTKLEIPATVTIIDNSGFLSLQSLEIVTIKGSTSIGHSAFAGCTSLKTVKMLATTPPPLLGSTSSSTGEWLQLNFNDIATNEVLLEEIVVPKGCGEAYRMAEGWIYYADYIVEAS